MNHLCQHLAECGGCTNQQLSYPEQLKIKQAQIEVLFPMAQSVIPCQNIWNYRNKMEFSFSQNKAGDRFLGLIMRRSRGKVLNLDECLLSPTWFLEMVKRVKGWWDESALPSFHFRQGTGTLRTLTLREGRRTGERLAMLTVSGDPRYPILRKHLNRLIELIDDRQMALFLRVQQCIPKVPTQFYEIHLQGPDHFNEHLTLQGKTLTFKVSPSSFFQPNTEQAEVIYATALEMAGSTGLVYDLYCGTATLGMAFALKAEKVVAIELNPYAVFDARINSERNGLENLTVECGDVGRLLSERQEEPDLVVVDPPRVGLDALAIAQLKRLKPRQILYISCNPTTQAKNCAELDDYTIEKVQPVDQFPHTPHIENIVLLKRR